MNEDDDAFDGLLDELPHGLRNRVLKAMKGEDVVTNERTIDEFLAKHKTNYPEYDPQPVQAEPYNFGTPKLHEDKMTLNTDMYYEPPSPTKVGRKFLAIIVGAIALALFGVGSALMLTVLGIPIGLFLQLAGLALWYLVAAWLWNPHKYNRHARQARKLDRKARDRDKAQRYRAT